MLTENAKHHDLTSEVWTVQKAMSLEQRLSQQEQVNSVFIFIFFYNKLPAIMTEDLTHNNLQWDVQKSIRQHRIYTRR